MQEKKETPKVSLENETPPVFQFDPPCSVFRIHIDTEKGIEVVVQEPLKKHDLTSRMRVAIPNPFKPDEDRFLPGVVYSNGVDFVMDVGSSFGQLGFHEDLGWFCSALVPKSPVMTKVMQDILQKIEQPTFTQRLLKRTK